MLPLLYDDRRRRRKCQNDEFWKKPKPNGYRDQNHSKDVAGLQEEKEDLGNNRLLKAPEKYTKVGARIPKEFCLRVLRTGKTLRQRRWRGKCAIL